MLPTPRLSTVESLIARLNNLLRTHPFESLFALPLILFYSWYTLALLGVFFGPLVLFIFLSVLLGAIALLSKRPAFCSLYNIGLSTLLLLMGAFALLSHPLEPVAEGRDQGSFLTSALLLRDNGGFSFALPKEAMPFFDIYGPGKALHLPGLAYTEAKTLVPEFPLGYIAWLGGFVTLFNIEGAAGANFLLYLLSGLLFSRLLRRSLAPPQAFVATALVLGSFLPLWFLSFTLSENLALFFFLLTGESVMRFRITKDRFTLLLALASSFGLALTRIEGWAVLAITLFLVSKGHFKKWIRETRDSSRGGSLFVLFSFSLLTVATLIFNTPYYKAIAKALWKSAGENTVTLGASGDMFVLYEVFWQYGLMLPFLGGLAGAFYLWQKGSRELLVPFFLSLAALPYLFFPHITFDAPWMLRRFLFALYPALSLSLFFSMSLALKLLSPRQEKVGWALFLALLLSIQIPLMRQFTQTSYTDTLLPQVEKLASQFEKDDLILIDKEVTGDNFMMPARLLSLLHKRNAIYFFNPEELSKLPTENFTRVFLVIPKEKEAFYRSQVPKKLGEAREFTFRNDHSFSNSDLGISALPQKKMLITPLLILEIE